MQTLGVRAAAGGSARAAPARSYHAHLTLDDSLIPGSSQIFNNHIPVDPDLQGAIAISKTTPLLNVVARPAGAVRHHVQERD